MGRSATFLSMQARFHKMRDRFAEKGRMTLAGCGSGAPGSSLLDLVSDTFLVCVSGFSEPITYGFQPDFPRTAGMRQMPRFGPPWFIRWRGRVTYGEALRRIEILGQDQFPMDMLSSDAWSLPPDTESCTGQLIVNAAKRSNTTKGIDALGSATEVGGRILREFFHEKRHLISGVRGDDNLRGLRFEASGSAGMLIVGKPYAQATSPATIDQRVAEMQEIITLAEFKRSGTVLMK